MKEQLTPKKQWQTPELSVIGLDTINGGTAVGFKEGAYIKIGTAGGGSKSVSGAS